MMSCLVINRLALAAARARDLVVVLDMARAVVQVRDMEKVPGAGLVMLVLMITWMLVQAMISYMQDRVMTFCLAVQAMIF